MGIKVNVEICRLPDEDGRDLLQGKNNHTPEELKRLTAELSKPFYQLRAKHEHNAQILVETVPSAEQHNRLDQIMRTNYIFPKGGYAKVELTSPINGKTYTGECHFSINTIFDRKLANLRAFGKMYSKMLTDSTMGRKAGKITIANLVS